MLRRAGVQCSMHAFDILLFKAPKSSPENITFTNVTLDSAVLQWSPIPEEDLQGFLQGFIIRYAEYNHKEITTMEKSKAKKKFCSLCEILCYF